jgi:peptide/nickel transport system ATP-binding protein
VSASNDLSFSVRIQAGARTLVDIDAYRVPERRLMVLFGESGIGKSLINRAVYGLLDPEEFHVTVNGQDGPSYASTPWVRSVQENGFFVFQEPSTHLYPLMTLGEQLREGSLRESRDEDAILRELWGEAPSGRPARLLGVYPKPYRPSGGEKQRMLLAMAFKKIDLFVGRGDPGRPALFLFDEPTGSLDNRFRDIVLRMLFDRYRRLPFTAVVVSHDYSMITMIRKEHPDLARAMIFRELALEKKTLVLRDFEPETYLRWLSAQRPAPPPAGDEGETPLARVESDLRVFGRSLRIARDRGGSAPAPLVLNRGGMAYLKAPSGTGKTTLAKMMIGLLRGDRFRMTLGRERVDERTPEEFWRRRVWGRRLTMVFQHADEALNPRSTVLDTFAGLPTKAPPTPAWVLRTLEQLFEPDAAREILEREVSRLSGGQKQRLNLLRGLSLETGLIILDEPLNGLDFESSVRVLDLLRESLARGSSILIISHNEEIFDSQVPVQGVYYLAATT